MIEDKQKRAQQLIDIAAKNIENGNEDTFRSYDEGVKDALEWAFNDSNEPSIEEECEE